MAANRTKAAEEPLFLPLWPDTGQILKLSRNTTYESAKRGEIPVLKFGRALRVPMAWVRQKAQLDPKKS
jgi:hypothetical protein